MIAAIVEQFGERELRPEFIRRFCRTVLCSPKQAPWRLGTFGRRPDTGQISERRPRACELLPNRPTIVVGFRLAHDPNLALTRETKNLTLSAIDQAKISRLSAMSQIKCNDN